MVDKTLDLVYEKTVFCLCYSVTIRLLNLRQNVFLLYFNYFMPFSEWIYEAIRRKDVFHVINNTYFTYKL